MQERRAVRPPVATARGPITDPGSPETSSPPVDRRPFPLLGGVAALILAADQATKALALEHLSHRTIELWWTLRLNLHFNDGGAFGFGQGRAPLFIAAGVVLLVVLLFAMRSVTGPGMAVALGLVVGGAVGNLVDRLLRDHGGAVIDFIDLQWWPIFNVADMAITCGAVLLLVTGGRRHEQ